MLVDWRSERAGVREGRHLLSLFLITHTPFRRWRQSCVLSFLHPFVFCRQKQLSLSLSRRRGYFACRRGTERERRGRDAELLLQLLRSPWSFLSASLVCFGDFLHPCCIQKREKQLQHERQRREGGIHRRRLASALQHSPPTRGRLRQTFSSAEGMHDRTSWFTVSFQPTLVPRLALQRQPRDRCVSCRHREAVLFPGLTSSDHDITCDEE